MFKVKLAAAIGAIMLAGGAHASIVTVDKSIGIPNNADGVYINFVTGATSSTQTSDFDFNPYSVGRLLFYWGGDVGNVSAGVASGSVYQDLAIGTTISSASSFSQAANGSNGETANFLTAGVHTLGFRFLNESTNSVNYGYARIETGASNGFPASILGWSYENTGAAITVANPVAAVPEPATWGMMILGMGAIGMAMRRRKNVSTTARFA